MKTYTGGAYTGAYSGGATPLGSQPFNSFGFANGASSPREAALFHEQNNNAMQHKLNQLSGGKRRSKSKRSTKKRRRSIKKKRIKSRSNKRRSKKQRGGSETAIEIPSFSPPGGITQAYSSTALSIGGNTNLVNGLNDAQGDCFATDTCKPASGGSRRSHRRRHRSKK